MSDLAGPSTTEAPKRPRRFAPQPVESSVRSSKQMHKTTENERDIVKRARKFAVEPPEVTNQSTKEPEHQTDAHESLDLGDRRVNSMTKGHSREASQPSRRRFLPQPIETSRITNRGCASEGNSPRSATPSVEAPQRQDVEVGPTDPTGTSSAERVKKPRRKFAVQLLESASRSRKAGDTGPTVPHSDRTEITTHGLATRDRRTPSRRLSSGDSLEDLAHDQMTISDEIAEARRLGLPLPKRRGSQANARSHSFRIPELDPIESSESARSDHSEEPSYSSEESMHGLDSREDSIGRRESVDSEYLVRIAARQRVRQLRDAALAAFPNDDRHRPVDHFVDKDDDSSSVSDTWSIAESDTVSTGRFVKISWELREMQKHAQGKAAAKKKEREVREAWRVIQKKNSATSPWGNAAAALYTRDADTGVRKVRAAVDSMSTMRKSARPPMLGSDIEFPRCPSPDSARFDVTQSSESQKRAMCYLSAQCAQIYNPVAARDIDKNGMWAIKSSDKVDKPKSALWGQASCPPSPDKGLWAGSCVGGANTTPPRGPTGLMTPMIQEELVMDNPIPALNPHHLPPSPPPSATGSERAASSLEEKLRLEQDIDTEFADAFVTQVYNYLSLGYPSMARKFDHELAKIARVEVSELRQDDVIAGARGYIRFGEENGLDVDSAGEEVKEHHCARWRALRLYVREWARQQPSWRVEQGGWGTVARRGSWAW